MRTIYLRLETPEGYDPKMKILLIALALYAPKKDDVLRLAEKSATDEFKDAIHAAIGKVDPAGERPEWRDELFRICKREAWCGKFGRVGVHEIDGWTGARSYAFAVRSGKLDPETCPEHRLGSYDRVLGALERWEKKAGRKLEDLRARLQGLPRGQYSARDFATRGGFGQNAARALHKLGECVAPSAMDDPRNAALVAAKTIAGCDKRGNLCSCADHVSMWVGAQRWQKRPVFAWSGKSKYKSLRAQCGEHYALRRSLFELGKTAFSFVIKSLFPKNGANGSA